MDIPTLLSSVHDETTAALSQAGDWLTGVQRMAVWHELRDAAGNPLDEARRRALSPFAVDGSHHDSEHLVGTAVDVVHRLATDPGRLSRTWADKAMAELGEEAYTELVAVTSMFAVIDRFDLVLNGGRRPIPAPKSGEPTTQRPDGVGDVGAWVSQSLDKSRANVSRALSLLPDTEQVWRRLVDSHYSRGAEFLDLAWDRALSRPQVELVAARTTALNECFY